MAEGGREGNMQVGDGGISNTVEVRGFSKKTSQELMEMYFENSRRSGGGDVDEVKIRDEVAYITFKEAEVAQRVASHSNHQVDGHTLTVTLFHPLPPKPCYQNRVLIQGLNNAITEELLRNFLETKANAQVTEILYGELDRNVVVTFSNNIDIVQLRKIFQESSIEGVFLKVERVAISNCILVQNLHPSTSHDVILYYFENKRRSGGGDVERVEMKTEERYCVIYFEDPSIIDRVLGRQSHNVDGVDFEIHLHHECLGRRSSRNKSDLYLRMSSPGNKDNEALENTDDQAKNKTSSSVSSNPEKESDFVEVQEWQENDGKNCTLPLWIKYKRDPDMKIIKCMKNIPCSWNFHLYWNFYTKTEPGKQMLHEILNKYNCSVAVCAEDEDLFLFEISEKIFEQESDVVQLIHVVLDSVHKCAQQFLYLDNILVDRRIQGDVLQVVRQRKELDIARFELMGQQDFDALFVICTEKDQTLVLHVVTEIIHMVKECFENHEETIHVDHKWQKVMKTFGYLQKLCEKYPSVTISDKTESAILLKGPRDQSKSAADLFLELLGTASSEVQEEIFSPGCQFEIFTYPEMCGYIDNITKELSIVWIPNHQTKKIYLFSKRSDKIKGVDKFIKGCVQERLYPLAKDKTGFSTEIIRSLEELKKMHTGKLMFSSSHNGLLLTATDDIFESIDDAVQGIICKETALMLLKDSIISMPVDRHEELVTKYELYAFEIKVFPCQWDKFEVRFETEDHSLSKSYTIKEVSPIQMQYIADNRDEKDSFLERFKSKHLKGILESGLLRIYLQEEKMKEDYLSEVKNEVITTLRSHIETDPAIQTKQLTQVIIENVQQAQELGHLECLRSNRVKIYICNSGRGVSVVGREVGKVVVESICRAYGETSKNDAVCHISESVGVNTENAAESLKQFKKESVESTESETRVTLDRSTIQLLTDSDFAGELCKKIPKVSVILLSSEVIFKGPHEALSKAKCYIEWHLKTKDYWHEVEQAASLIETSKRLNFEAYLKGKIPDVHVLFSDGKIIFIGKESTFKACKGELAKFQSTINRDCIPLKIVFLSYLKLQDVQNYIWERFESEHIECYWQVIQNGIEFFYRNVEHLSAAKSALLDSAEARQLSFKSVIDLQEFENSPDVKNLIHENKGRLYKGLQGNVLMYVGMPEVVAQIKELYGRHKPDRKNHSHGHSSDVLLSHILLAYVNKYLMENIRDKFDVNVFELSDLSGIKITGAKDHVTNAVSEVKKILDQKQVYIDSLEISKMTTTIARQIKEHVDTVEAENMTCVEIVSIPIKGKETFTVSVGKALDVCLVYGSTPESVVMQIIPVNDSLYTVCLASTDIMKKGVNLQEKAARALRKYLNENGKKPNAFKFIPDDDGSSDQHIVFFVMPDFSISMEDFQKQFQAGLLTVFDHAYTKNVTSLSLPIEMDEKLSVRQMFTVIMETLNIFLGKVLQPIDMKEIFLCSAEKSNQSILKQLLESTIPGGEIITKNYFGYDEEEDKVKIAVVTGSLLDENLNVDVIVNSTTAILALQSGSLSKAILDAAGYSIQDECMQKYPDGIKFGEVAVTSAGKLHLKRIFHGALKKVEVKHFRPQSLRSLMKNCLQKVKEEKCHSIAFPALGVGQLQYPVEDVAKEMFKSVINHADKYGVKLVKFVLPESDVNIYTTFKEMENTKNSLLQSSTDCNPEYEVSLEGCGLKIDIVVAKKYTMPCDVDIVFGSPSVDELTEKHTLKYRDSTEKIFTVKRDSKHWSETLFLCLTKDSSFKEELLSAVYYVQHMKFTSVSVHMSQLLEAALCKSMIEDVIEALDACKSNVGDVERVMIVINDTMLQSLTPWFDENVKASQKSKTFINTVSQYFGFKGTVIWKKFHTPCTQTSRTYVRIAGDASLTSSKICDTIQKRLKELETNEEQSGARSSGSQSSNSSTGSYRMVVCSSFRTEVTEAVLNIIEDKLGSKGVDSLISALKQVANVDTSNGKIEVSCDFKQAEEVQNCISRHYQKATQNKHSVKDSMERHLIEGGNSDIKDLLEFAYGNTDWSKKLEVEGDKLYVLGTSSMKEKAEEAVQTITQWYHEEFFLTENEKQKADEAILLVRSEFPEIFIKQNNNNDKISLNVANEDNFAKAKHKIKVALGRIKIVSSGKNSISLLPRGETSLSLPQNDRQESSLMSLPSIYQTSQSRTSITSKTYYTREGIAVKVYIGDIVRLPVDCIVNDANKNLSHGGGVALAIAKAAGREFDQESEEYVRKHGIIPVAQCCVTSAGRLPYKCVIHVVGPQWHDYMHNEKDKCGVDLKKTIVNCLIKAMKLKINSIVIPSISSGIFGVPKIVCAQMYVQGVVEFSRTYSLQSDCLKEIHFVDMLPEMCNLTQLAFDNVFSTRSSKAALQEDGLAPSAQRYPKAEVKTQNEASAAIKPPSYAEVTSKDQGSKQNPYIIKPCDGTSILIYNHDITDVVAGAVVYPVSPNVDGGGVKSYSVKKECETYVTSPSKANIPLHIYIYSSWWTKPEEQKPGKTFEKLVKTSVQNIFNEVKKHQIASVALPILGTGDKTTIKLICEYIMDGISKVCADPQMLPVGQITIHLVTNETSVTNQLKDIGCQQFGQKCQVKGEALQTADRSVLFSKQQNFQVTMKNANATRVTQRESCSSHIHSNQGDYEKKKTICPVCLKTLLNPRTFTGCGHVLCKVCMEHTVKNKPVCPVCGKIYKIITGNQPNGTMEMKTTNYMLPGFKNCGTIEIFYSFPAGIQTEGHPNPGKPYHGTSRCAYLPDKTEGRKVLSLLKKAFDRRLVFTVGRSVTTGTENTVTWNGIHHKTNIYGGPQSYGYPDADYLKRVQEELAAMGVTEDAI